MKRPFTPTIDVSQGLAVLTIGGLILWSTLAETFGGLAVALGLIALFFLGWALKQMNDDRRKRRKP